MKEKTKAKEEDEEDNEGEGEAKEEGKEASCLFFNMFQYSKPILLPSLPALQV